VGGLELRTSSIIEFLHILPHWTIRCMKFWQQLPVAPPTSSINVLIATTRNSARLCLISVQSSGRTRSSSVVTLARPSVSSSLQITNRSFRYAPPHLWNQLPSSFRQPHCVHSPPGSPHPTYITSSHSSPSFCHSLDLSLQT